MKPIRNLILIFALLAALIVSAAITVAYTRKQAADGKMGGHHGSAMTSAGTDHHGGSTEKTQPDQTGAPNTQIKGEEPRAGGPAKMARQMQQSPQGGVTEPGEAHVQPQAPAPEQSGGAAMDHSKMRGAAPAQPQTATPDQVQLDASRLQLEASRAQLDASRKLLEAAPDVPLQARPSGAAQRPATPAPPVDKAQPKAADGHAHQH